VTQQSVFTARFKYFTERVMEKKKAIKKGDIVTLKSGGPRMTVQSISESKPGPMGTARWVRCIWFNNNLVNEYNFDEEILKVVAGDK
jgi:uncharacterized protein YodC (DUF2158 family)